MKCVGLLVFVVLIQSVNKFIELHHHEVQEVKESNNEYEYDESGNDISTKSETQSDNYSGSSVDEEHAGSGQDEVISDSGSSVDEQHAGSSETFKNRQSGQEEVISETTKEVRDSDDRFESRKLYDQHSQKIFPRICMDGLTGLMTDIVGNFITSFSNLHSALSGSTRCESSTLSSVSTVLFTIVDSMANLTGSSFSVLSSLNNALPGAFFSITEVVSGLDIQTLATQLSGAISDLQKSLTTAIQIVNDAEKLEFDVKKLNTAITLVVTSAQAMLNTVNFIAHATTKAIGSVSTEMQEAVVSLSLVLATVLVIVQSVFASTACVLSSLQISSATLNKVLVTLDITLERIISVITSTSNSVSGSMSVVVGTMSMTLTYLANKLNELNSSLDNLTEMNTQSSVELDVSNSLKDLLDRLSEFVGNIAIPTANSVTSITSSLNIISKASFGMLPKVANQISPVFAGLSKLTGTDDFIVNTLVTSLPSFFNSIKSASKNLVFAIGVQTSEEINKFTGNVQLSIESLLSLINGTTKGNVKIQDIVQGIGQSVQYVAATVTSITSTISNAISAINIDVVEAALSLPFILSAVLYVAQWVLSVAVSVFASIAGSVSEILSKLTVIISVTLETVSKIILTISGSASDSLVDIFDSIAPYYKDLGQLVTSSFTKISGVVVNIVFNIDEIISGAAKQDEKPTAGMLHGTEGSVLEILSGLPGKLSSISPALSSSLSSLNNSLTACSTLDFTALKLISSILVLVISLVTKVTGSATEILSLISDALGGVFGHISTILSRFSVLGDVSVSLKTSVSNIQSALRSLIDTINDLSSDSSILNDPIKNVAKTVQILVSTLFAIVDAASRANEDVVNNLSEAIINLTYVVSSIILVVQYVVGAAIADVLTKFGSIPTNLQQLALAMSSILQTSAAITANITVFVSGSDAHYTGVISKILSSVSDLNSLASASLSAISGVLANINVSLKAPKNVVE